MNDELDTLGRRDTDLKHPTRLVSADEHREIVERERSDRVAEGMEHVVVGDPVLASAHQNDWVLQRQYILTRRRWQRDSVARDPPRDT